MNCNNIFSIRIFTVLVMTATGISAIPRVLPHTIIFKNTSDVEQVVWISSEYILKGPETQAGSDLIRHPVAPNSTFKYGGKEYVFNWLEVRLSPFPNDGVDTFANAVEVHGLAASVSIVTIFDEGECTVRNKESLSHRLWKARLKTQAARKVVKEKFNKAGRWVRSKWGTTKDNISRFFKRTKQTADAGALRVSDAFDQASHRAGQARDHAKERLHEGKERAKDALENVSEHLGEAKEKTKERTQEVLERAKEGLHEGKEKAKVIAHKIGEKTKEIAHTVEEKTKDALEYTAQELGEIKERVKQGWQKGQEQARANTQDRTSVRDSTPTDRAQEQQRLEQNNKKRAQEETTGR